MDLNLLMIGRKTLGGAFDFERFSVLLSDKGYKTDRIYYIDDGSSVGDILGQGDGEALYVACGDLTSLYDFFGENVAAAYGYVRIGDRYFVPMPTLDENVVRSVVIPLMNRKTKSSYNTVIFKTFGVAAEELKELLKEYTKGRNKIFFEFAANGQMCDVRIRYAKSVQSAAITEVIEGVTRAIGGYIYATKDISLAEQTARLLMGSGKKLSLAESFTGGGLASALVAYPGMSNNLLESVVCYTNDSKTARLRVPREVLESKGAVSGDTAYEMALGLLDNPKCDIAVATTGNAGPTSEKEGQVGLFYVAVGDRQTIHVFERFYEVKNADKKSVEELRHEITETGVNTALFELERYLSAAKGDI